MKKSLQSQNLLTYINKRQRKYLMRSKIVSSHNGPLLSCTSCGFATLGKWCQLVISRKEITINTGSTLWAKEQVKLINIFQTETITT